MLTFKNGKLKIGFERTLLERLLDLSFVLVLSVLFAFGAGAQEGEHYLYYIAFFFMLGMTVLLKVIGHSRVFVKLPTLWYGVFILFSLLSAVWARYSADLSLRYISRMVQILIICFCATLYMRSKKDLERFLSIFLTACLIMVVSVFAREPVSDWFSGFLGAGVTGNNTNVVAYTCVAGTCIALYKAYFLKKRGHYLSLLIILSYIVLSSSRKALAMSLIMCVGMLLFFVGRRTYILKIAAVVLVFSAAMVAIFEIPELYHAVGFRFERMFEFFLEGDVARDSSLALRMGFIEVARDAFLEHPFFGIGLANVGYLILLSFGRQTYAHNNYLELASGLGIVGFALYYWFYVYLLVKLVKRAYRGDPLCASMFFLLIVMLIGELAMVTFYNVTVGVMLTVCFCAAAMKEPSYEDPAPDRHTLTRGGS